MRAEIWLARGCHATERSSKRRRTIAEYVRASRSRSSASTVSSTPKNESSAVRLPSTSSSSEKIKSLSPTCPVAELQEQRARELHRAPRRSGRRRAASGAARAFSSVSTCVSPTSVKTKFSVIGSCSAAFGPFTRVAIAVKNRSRGMRARMSPAKRGSSPPPCGHAVAQLVRAGQVDRAPHAALGLVAELVVGAREQLVRLGVARVGEHEMVEQRRGPAIVAALEGRARLLLHRRGAAHRLDVLRAELDRRQRIEVRRVAVVPAEVELVDRLRVVAQRPVVAAVREALARAAAAARAARRSRAASRPGSRAAASGRG